MSERFTIRPATTADLGTIADSLVAGLSTYRGWTPIGWNPPGRTEMLIGLLQRFPHDGSWAHIASEGPRPAGHISLRPDRDEDDEPRSDVALLTQLFVREEYWGSGLAGAAQRDRRRRHAAARLRAAGGCSSPPVTSGRARSTSARAGARPASSRRRASSAWSSPSTCST